MKLTKFEYHRREINGVRHYDTPIGEFPSVTAILSATKDRTYLDKWKNKIGEEAAELIMIEAAERGKHLHSAVETKLLGQEPLVTDIAAPYWESLNGDSYLLYENGESRLIQGSVVELIGNVLLVEGALYHPIGYAGSVDCVAEFGDYGICVIDWKTSDKKKPEYWISDYKLQLAAYIAACNRLYDLRISIGVVGIAVKDQPAQVFVITGKQLMECWLRFQEKLIEYKRVFQPALSLL
jgi:hypothetical protein